MAHPLEALLVLQEKDRKISKLRRELRDIPVRKAEIETQLERAKTRLTASLDAQQKISSDLKQIELEVEGHREKITRYKDQQGDAKTNDQYRALLHQVASEEQEVSVIEDRQMVLLEQMEASKKVIAEREAELLVEEDGIREEQEMLLERLAEVEEDIESLIAARERLSGNISPSLISKYDRLFANKGDFAVVRVENCHCKGCNMRLPPQVVNDALNPAKLVICNYCGRMLVNL